MSRHILPPSLQGSRSGYKKKIESQREATDNEVMDFSFSNNKPIKLTGWLDAVVLVDWSWP